MSERILIETKLRDKYKNFIKYCRDSEKIFVDELTETDFIAYRTKYLASREEIEILKSLLKSKQSEMNLFAEPEINLFAETSEEKSTPNLRKVFDVTDLKPYENILIANLNFNNRVQNQLEKNNCTTLIELLSYSVPELSALKNFGSNSITNILDVLENFFGHSPILQENIEQPELIDKESLKSFAEDMINSAIKNKKQYDIICERIEGKTLSELGKIFQVTRERVRQIESTVIKKFSLCNHRKLKILFESIREQLSGKNFITFEDLKNFTGETPAKILWFFISRITFDKKILYLDKKANAIILGANGQDKIDYDKLIVNLPEILHEDELNEEIEKIVKEQNCSEELLRLKIVQNYKRKGKFFYRGRLTLNFQCGYVLRERFQSGYKISDETHYKRFVRYLREFFDYKGEFSQRALDAKISCYVGVLCDRGKYIHPDFLHVPQKIILLINDYIEKSERTVLPYKEIFTALKENFVGTQIINPYILQGVIKSSGTPYSLYRDYLTKDSNVNLAAEFNSFVKKNGEVSAQDIKAQFISFYDYNISQLLERCHEIINVGNGKFLHSTRLNLQEDDFAEIEKFLYKNCSDSPVSSRYLFNLFWEHFQDFLYRNKIEDADKLFGILKYMFGDKFKFSRPYISATNIDNITNKKVLLQYLEGKNKIEIEDILNIREEQGIRYIARTILIEELSPEFIRVDEFYLSRPESIGVNDEVIATVIENVQLVMERNGGWQSAKTFPDFEWLPRLNISWNSFLLESIVKLAENHFKIFHSYSRSGKISTAVFVSEEFEENNFDSFCLKILIDEHDREPFNNKNEILNWLRENGLADKKLPKFLEEHIILDKYDKISLR